MAWYYNKWEKEAAEAAQKRALEAAEKPRKPTEEKHKRAEEKRKNVEEERVKAILEHRDEWGDIMCYWLVSNQYSLTDSRIGVIMENFATLGQDTSIRLLQKIIAIGDSPYLAKLALGEPTDVDEEVINRNKANSDGFMACRQRVQGIFGSRTAR